MTNELHDNRNLVLFSGGQTKKDHQYYHFSESFLTDRLAKITSMGSPNVLFVPWATWHNADERKMFNSATEEGQWGRFGLHLTNISDTPDKTRAIEKADAIIVGGGSIHTLMAAVQEYQLIEPLRARVRDGILYIGTSAGSVLATPGIYGSNEPPILHLRSHSNLGIVPFGLTPHFVNSKEHGNSGPSIRSRIKNFIILNPNPYPILAIHDGTWLNLEKGRMTIQGEPESTLFAVDGREIKIPGQTDITFLLDEKSDYFKK